MRGCGAEGWPECRSMTLNSFWVAEVGLCSGFVHGSGFVCIGLEDVGMH